MAAAEFKKGQIVNVYAGEFYTAAVTVTQYTVASCGTKQLHLLRNDGSNAEWRAHAPFRGGRRYSDVQAATVDPVAHAAQLRAQFAAWTFEHYVERTARAAEGLRDGMLGAKFYAAGIAESRAKFEAGVADLLPQLREQFPEA